MFYTALKHNYGLADVREKPVMIQVSDIAGYSGDNTRDPIQEGSYSG